MHGLWQNDINTPPPERHADRVIAEMLRDLARKRALTAKAIGAAMGASKDGTPRAQQRMADRIQAAGAIAVELNPGKRGRYTMLVYDLVGWDRVRDDMITPTSAIPEKPWLACLVTRITDRGRDIKTVPMMFLTHHAISRAAQRFQVRTAEHIVGLAHSTLCEVCEHLSRERWHNPPPQGHHIPIGDGATAVLRLHEDSKTLFVATFIWKEEQ